MSVAHVADGTEQSASAVASITPALPAGVTAGQVLVATVYWTQSTVRTPQAVAGWTYHGRSTQGACLAQYVRVATGSDTAPTITFTGAFTTAKAIVSSYSGADAAAPVAGGCRNGVTSTTTVSGQSWAKAGSMAVWAGAFGGTNNTTSTTTGATKRNAASGGWGLFDAPFAAAAGVTLDTSYAATGSPAMMGIVLNPDKTFAPIKAGMSEIDTSGAALSAAAANSNAAAGMLAVMWVRSNASSNVALTAPAGWSTLIASFRPNATYQWAAYYRELTGADLDLDSGVWASAGMVAPGGGGGTVNLLIGFVSGHLPGGPYFSGTGSRNDYVTAGAAKFSSMTPADVNTQLLLLSAGVSSDTYDARATVAGSMSVSGTIASAPGPATITATGDYTHTAASGNGTDLLYAIKSQTQPPLAPTLQLPANASYRDLAAGDTFDWDFNAGSAGDTQTAYALRRKISGAGSYEYWNAGTNAWQAGIVWNTDTNTAITFGSGKWTNGNVYNWSVATRSAFGDGPFAADNTVNASTNPTLTVTAPSGTATVASPPVLWTDTLAGGASQTAYRVIIESGAYGTTPGSGTQLYDSGTVASAATTITPPVVLPNGGTYRVFVRVTQTGGQVSSYAYSTFTVVYNAPAQPTVTASWDATHARAAVVIQGQDNMLTTDDSSVEGGLGTWVNLTNATLAQSSTVAANGSQALRMTAGAAADMAATTATGTSGYPVVVGKTYTALASFRAGATAKNTRVSIAWYDAAGALLSTTAGGTVADGTGGFTQATVSGAAPAGAAFAAVQVTVLAAAAGGIHYVDKMSLAPGTSTTWASGGFTPAYLVEQSSDAGLTWLPVRGSNRVLWDTAADQSVTVYDYETPPNTARRYRATSVANYSSPTTIVASPVSASTADITAALTTAWLKDPLDPTSNVALSCLDGITQTRGRSTTVLQPLGATYPVVQSDVRRARTAEVGVTPATQAEADAISHLLDSTTRTLLLQRPPSSTSWRGLNLYCVVSGDDATTPLADAPIDTATITFPVAEVRAPAVP